VNLFSKWVAAAALAAFPAAARSQTLGTFLMVVDSSQDRVMLFDANDGSLIVTSFISFAAAGLVTGGNATPKEALQVGNQIWIVDSLQDCIYRFKADYDNPTYLGRVAHPADGGGIDNPRGLAYLNGTVYVTNGGTDNSAPGESIVKFDFVGLNLGSFPVTNPFDVVTYDGDLLITNIDDDDIDRFTVGGASLGKFHDGTGTSGLDFPQQAFVRANGNVLAASFGSVTRRGIYEYTPAGVLSGFWNVGTGDRGVVELGNGLYFFTYGQNIDTVNPISGATASIISSTAISAQYANFVTFVCPSDFDGNTFVNGNDFDAFVIAFEAGDAIADWDGNGFLNGEDFDAFVIAFEAGC